MWHKLGQVFFSVPIRDNYCKFWFHYLPNNLPTTDFFGSGSCTPPKAFAISVAMSAADACGCETDGADEPAGLFST